MHDKQLIIQFRVISKRINNSSSSFSSFFSLYIENKNNVPLFVPYLFFFVFDRWSLFSLKNFFLLFFFRFVLCAHSFNLRLCGIFLLLLLCIVYCLPVHELTFFSFSFFFFSMSVFIFFLSSHVFFSFSVSLSSLNNSYVCVRVCSREKNKLFSE